MRTSRYALAAAFLVPMLLGVSAAGSEPAPFRLPGSGPELDLSKAGSCEETQAGYSCTAGPFAFDDADDGALVWTGLVQAIPKAGYITSMRATAVDSLGHALPRHAVHLHHAVWLNPNKIDMTCDQLFEQSPVPDRFFATGKERTKIAFPEGFGYHWEGFNIYNGNSVPFYHLWAMNTHLHWMHDSYTPDVSIRLDLGFTPVAEAAGDMVDIRPVWFDVDNCGDSEFDVPGPKAPGTNHKEKWSYTMPVGGRLIALGGHLHDGGKRLTLYNKTKGKRIYVSEASYRKGMTRRESGWDLRKMSVYSGLPGKKIEAGDQLRLTAVYDHSKNWEEVMGIMIGALYEDP